MAGVDLSFGATHFPRAQEVREQLYESGCAGNSTRYRELDRLDAFYKCLEYAHIEYDWNGYPADKVEAISSAAVIQYGMITAKEDLKVHQRRPTAPQRLTPLVVDRFTDLLFGEDRTPRVRVEDDPQSDDFLQAVFKRSFFWRTMTIARTYGGSMGSALITAHVRPDKLRKKGRFIFKAHSPKTVADVVWDDQDAGLLSGVLIQYTFEKEIEELDEKTGRPTGRTQKTTHLYRRIIDEEMDIAFIPERINGTRLPDLRVDEHNTHRHNLGIFPGVFVQNLPNPDELDGIPDCDGAYQMFEAVDRQMSQQNRALLYNQDPTLVLARDKNMEKLNIPVRKGSENALNVGMGGSAQYLEMSGGAQTASAAFTKDVRQAAMDKCGVVLADPPTISAAASSALAIKLLFEPMLKKASRLRDQFGWAIDHLSLVTLELGRHWMQPTEYEGNVKPAFDLEPRIEEHDANPLDPDAPPEMVRIDRVPGEGSLISVKWGAFFPLTAQEIGTIVSTLSTAVQSNLIDIETGIQFAAEAFGVEDVEGLKRKVLDAIQAAKDEAAASYPGGMFPEPQPFDLAAGGGSPEHPNADPVADPEADPNADPAAQDAPGGPGAAAGVATSGQAPQAQGQAPGSGSYATPEPETETSAPEPGASAPSGLSGIEGTEMLNGAQVTAALEIIAKVATSDLPREEAKRMLVAFFGLSEETADRVLGQIGITFFAEEEPPEPQRW